MVLPVPAEKPMAQVNEFMNQDEEEKPTESAVEPPQHYNRGSIECIDAGIWRRRQKKGRAP